MKKILIAMLGVLLVFAFVGCATAAKEEKSDSDEWWNTPPADTAEFHYEIGYAKYSTKQTSRDAAKANANTSLAQYVSNTVDAIVVSYTNDAGEISNEGNNLQALQAFESISKQKAQAVLTGVTYKFHDEEDGSCFVLAALPIGPVAEELKANVTEAFKRNQAAETANKMMDAAIDKYFGTPSN